ncbi:MAG TPA: hypothetical protein VEW03_09055 [Longimicrobiaceae bacterium]|nr:hypothetical protein [Longimicrobiaceae bacterium]
MRLSTRVHGALDYAVGALMIVLPFVLGLGGGAERWILVAVGVATIAWSLATDYELGVLRKLQIPHHLWLDGIGGVLLAVSPWLFGFDGRAWVPHVALGLFAAAAAVFTDTIPSYERRGAR